MLPGVTTRTFACSQTAGATVAVEAERVVRILDPAEVQDTAEPLARFALDELLSEVGTPAQAVRLLQVSTEAAPFLLQVGEKVRFVQVAADAVLPMPTLLRDGFELEWISGLLAVNERFAFVLNVDRLGRLCMPASP